MAKEKEKIFAVLGLGTFGGRVCEVLAQRGEIGRAACRERV